MSTTTEMLSSRVPKELKAALAAHARERGEDVSETVRRALLRELGRCPTCGRGWSEP